jgi:hypothetical protein
VSVRRKDEAAIWDMINQAREEMTFAQKRLWEVIHVLPEKWSYSPRPMLVDEPGLSPS